MTIIDAIRPTTATVTTPTSVAARVRRIAGELTLAGTGFLLYRQVRHLTSGDADLARSNARDLLELQQRLVGAPERAVQELTMRSELLVAFLNRYYVGVHFPLTIAFILWLLVRHPDRYRSMRNWLLSATAVALVVHVAFPLAPPRMMPGFVDTLRVYGPNIYPADPADSVANQFAAMPSLHFGWSVIVAVGFVLVVRRRWSLVAIAHPAITLLAIVGTGNHYLVDAGVAGVIVAVTALAIRGVGRRPLPTTAIRDASVNQTLAW